MTAAAVALGGNIAFVGLVVPHALRPFVGSEHRRLVPAALGHLAAFEVTSAVPSRRVVRGMERLGISVNGVDNASSPATAIGRLQEAMQLYSTSPSKQNLAEKL